MKRSPFECDRVLFASPGTGGARFVLCDFFFLSSVVVSITSRRVSLSPLSELVAVRFLRGGRDGIGGSLLVEPRKEFFFDTDLRAGVELVSAELLAMLMQLTPF